jgi:hypothetical protein
VTYNLSCREEGAVYHGIFERHQLLVSKSTLNTTYKILLMAVRGMVQTYQDSSSAQGVFWKWTSALKTFISFARIISFYQDIT